MTPEWRRRLARESWMLVLCLICGLLLPMDLLLLSLIPMHFLMLDVTRGLESVHMGYVDFLAAVTGVARRPLSTPLGWILFLAPYTVYQSARLILWSVRSLRAR